jgi:hypothetical protein
MFQPNDHMGKTNAINRLFRRYWWQFWKPRMPVITPTWVLIPTLRPEDLAGYLTPEQVDVVTRATFFNLTAPPSVPTPAVQPTL